MTDYEKSLWMCLRKKQLGYRFLRQYSIDNFILDFYCPKRKIAIEVDGTQHSNKENLEYDMLRTFHLEALGIKVLRFTNEEIFQNLEKVIEEIRKELT